MRKAKHKPRPAKQARKSAAASPARTKARREAAKWLEALQEGLTPRNRNAFSGWLARSAVNARELSFAQAVAKESRFAFESRSVHLGVMGIDCWECGAEIPVICLCARQATVAGEAQSGELIRMSEITAMDSATAAFFQRKFPSFRQDPHEAGETAEYANHCPKCRYVYEDTRLRNESPFTLLTAAPEGLIRYFHLDWKVRLDCSVGSELPGDDSDPCAVLQGAERIKPATATPPVDRNYAAT